MLKISALADALGRKVLLYDKTGEEHYNLISALHKSVRSSDPDAALYWLARMLEAGEDRMYIARRVVRMAIEDVGLADPRALEQCMAMQGAVHFLGMPEDLFVGRAEVGCGVSRARRGHAGGSGGACGAGADAVTECFDRRDEGVGIWRRVSARACV